MIYDLSNALQAEQYKLRCNALFKKQAIVELTEKKVRTLNQNAYLSVIIRFFAKEHSMSEQEVKQYIFKLKCNPDIFVEEKDVSFVGCRKTLKSSASISKEQMNIAIERFRNWSAAEANTYIPSPDEKELVNLMLIESERYNPYQNF